MSSKNKLLMLFFVMLLASLMPFATARDNFNAQSNHASVSACACTSFTDEIIIKNTGTAISTYLLSLKGDAASWATLSQNSFILSPGNSIRIINRVGVPCSARGDKVLDVIITSSSGLSKKLTQKISAKNCPNIGVNINDFARRVCPCKPVRYDFEVTNTGEFTETYDFSIDHFEEYTVVNYKSVEISPGQTAPLTMYIQPPCEVYGNYNLTMSTFARNSKFLAKTPIMLDIDKCYDYDIRTEGSLTLCERTEDNTLTVKIDNPSEVDNTYYLGLSAPEWAELDDGFVSVDAGDSAYMNITMSPPAGSKDKYEFELTSFTEKGDMSENLTIKAKVIECYDYEILLPEVSKVCCGISNHDIIIKNNGKLNNTLNVSLELEGADIDEKTLYSFDVKAKSSYTLPFATDFSCDELGAYTIGVTAVSAKDPEVYEKSSFTFESVSEQECYAADISPEKVKIYKSNEPSSATISLNNQGLKPAIYTVSLDNPPEWVSLSKEVLEIENQESAGLDLVAGVTQNVSKGKYVLFFTISAEGQNYTQAVELKLTEPSKAEVFVLNMWDDYAAYIIAGILIVVLFIIASKKLASVRERRIREAVKKPKKEKVIKRKKCKAWKWVMTIIVLFIVIFGALKIYISSQPAGNETSTNETGQWYSSFASFILTEEEGNETGDGYEGEPEVMGPEPVIEENFTYRLIDPEEAEEINLSSIFFDEDQDELVFDYEGGENLVVEFYEGVALITAVPGWTGESSIRFTADDTKGGLAETPEITFLVNEASHGLESDELNYWEYALIGVTLLVVIIGIIHTSQSMQEKPKKRKKKP